MPTFNIDDAYLGGEPGAGKAGRGSDSMPPFAGAVSRNESGHPMYMKFALVNGFTSQAITPARTSLSRRAPHFARTMTAVLFDGLDVQPLLAVLLEAANHLRRCVRSPQIEPPMHLSAVASVLPTPPPALLAVDPHRSAPTVPILDELLQHPFNRFLE